MPLTLVGTGTQIKPIFVGETLPANTPVPSRREAVEALGIVQKLATQHHDAVLVDGAPMTWDQAFDCLRRFILTR